jgi:hypothetical protein
MNIHLCVYSNKKYEVPRKALINLAESSGIFESIFEYDREWLEKTQFYLDNLQILGDLESKGDGWCLWKPFVMLESMGKIPTGDVLLYMDSSDTFFGNFESFLCTYFGENDILLTRGGNTNSKFTRRDTFFYMGCDSPEYWNSPQVEAGVIGMKKCERSLDFLEEYLGYCRDPRIIMGGGNQCGLNNFPDYIDHRYDQSVLGILGIKNKIEPTDKIRPYIECNIWEAITQESNGLQNKIGSVVGNIIFHQGSEEILSTWKINYLSALILPEDTTSLDQMWDKEISKWYQL